MIELHSGDPAPIVKALDGTAQPVSLDRFWREGPAVVVFLRHWG